MKIRLVSEDYRGSSRRAVSKARIPEPGAEPSLFIQGPGCRPGPYLTKRQEAK